MNAIETLRTQLGVSQQVMANMLGVPRSTLAMAEAGTRPLPHSGRMRLAELQLVLQQPQTFVPTSEEIDFQRSQDMHLKARLEKKIGRLNSEFQAYETELTQLRQSRIGLKSALQTISAKLADDKITGEFRIGLELDRTQLLDKWNRSRPLMQDIIQAKMRANRMMAEEYAGIVSRLQAEDYDPFLSIQNE